MKKQIFSAAAVILISTASLAQTTNPNDPASSRDPTGNGNGVRADGSDGASTPSTSASGYNDNQANMANKSNGKASRNKKTGAMAGSHSSGTAAGDSGAMSNNTAP